MSVAPPVIARTSVQEGVNDTDLIGLRDVPICTSDILNLQVLKQFGLVLHSADCFMHIGCWVSYAGNLNPSFHTTGCTQQCDQPQCSRYVQTSRLVTAMEEKLINPETRIC